MEDIELYLNILSDERSIYGGIVSKLGANISCEDDLGAYLSADGKGKSYAVYISNEDAENDTVKAVMAVFEEFRDNGDISLKIKVDEFLNLIDDDHHMLPEVKPRSLIHRDGDLHPAVHMWIVKVKDMGIYVLMQKRSAAKDVHPSCYDVSAAGHVPQGEEFRKAALREAGEELGLTLHESKLQFLGFRKTSYSSGNIKDNEIRAVYMCREKVNTTDLVLQEAEVDSVCWAEIDELLAGMADNSFENCIDREELKMIKKAVC